jgi:hypothetical protein
MIDLVILVVFGLVMLMVAWSIRPAESRDDAIFRPPS